MTKHKNCILCGSGSIKKMKNYEKHHLVKCLSCKFVFCEPIPTELELEKHYENYGRNDYLSPLTIKRYHEILDSFEPYRKTNKLIDVGCGIGYFLEEAKKRGWEVYGTEFTDEAIEICSKKGIKMNKGVLTPNNYTSQEFDVITSFEVIEHINNPQEELAHFYKILRKGGLVYCTTPNFNSLLRYRLKEKYNVLCYPEHLSYYTPKTLKHVFEKEGFRTKSIKATGLSLTRLKTSKSTSNQELISKTSDDEIIRNRFENNVILKILKKSINWFLTVFGVGDALKGTFIKD
jgi:2-polyprenyl-3-methyl-5-hydroxy-6-metoxy-1,4-benzoquinol methylase